MEFLSLHKFGLAVVSGNCETHGEYKTAGREIDPPRCPHCFQTRIEREARELHEIERAEQLLKISNIPERYKLASFKSYQRKIKKQQSAVDLLVEWIREIKNTPKNLVITGGIGTGKTHLVCAAMRNLMHSGVSCRYETTASLLAEIKKAYGDKEKSEAGQIAEYTDRYQVLVIDEADISRMTDNDLGLLFAVINGRYNNMRAIVLISNQTAAQMPKWLGERSASRISENATIVACDWPDYRAKAA